MADKKTSTKGGGAAAPATQTAAPAKPATTATNGDGAGEQRKRNFLSPQKALAIAIAGLVALLDQESIAKLLDDEQKAQVRAAAEMADELNSQTIKPIQTRITAIHSELAELAKPENIIKPETVKAVQERANELARLNKRLETFTGAATQTI